MAQNEGARVTPEAVVVSMYPDVCLTPSGPSMVPVPYPIIAKFDQSSRQRTTVRFGGCEAMTDFGRLLSVMGDEAGMGKGIMSGMNMGMCRPLTYSTTVRINGQHVVYHTSLIAMNCMGPEGPQNTVGSVMYASAAFSASARPESQVKSSTTNTLDSDGFGPEADFGPEAGEQVLGLFVGFGKGAWDMIEGAGMIVEGAYDLTLGWAETPDKSLKTAESLIGTVGAIISHPEILWDGFKKPYVDAWSQGKYGEAIGRGMFEVASLVALAGSGQAAKAGEVAKVGAASAKAAEAAKVAGVGAKVGEGAKVAGSGAKVVEGAEAAKAAEKLVSGADGIKVKGSPFTPKKAPGTLEPGAVSGELIPGARVRAPELPSGWDEAYDLSQPGREGILDSFAQTPMPDELPPGTKIYRVIGDDSNPAGSFWSLDPPPATEAAWRADSAVKNGWNGDGAYVEYTVGPDGLKVLKGPAAPQKAAQDGFILPGGGEQIYIPPNTVTPSAPQPTPWNG